LFSVFFGGAPHPAKKWRHKTNGAFETIPLFPWPQGLIDQVPEIGSQRKIGFALQTRFPIPDRRRKETNSWSKWRRRKGREMFKRMSLTVFRVQPGTGETTAPPAFATGFQVHIIGAVILGVKSQMEFPFQIGGGFSSFEVASQG